MLSLKDTLLDRVHGTIRRYQMAAPRERIGVAVSGGADSVVLLHLLHRLAAALEVQLTILHVNHHLRGSESDGDELFVRELAAELSMDFVAGTFPIEQPGHNLEESARDERRRFFRELLDAGKIDRVATGHTRSDQAETVLFRLFRGSGLAGLSGMSFRAEGYLIRPLLGVSRDEIRQWALDERISWRDDSSNLDPRFRRNRIRHEFLPLAREAFHPRIEEVLAGTAALAQTEEDYWDKLIAPLFAKFAQNSHLGLICDLNFLQSQHLAVRRRLIRHALGAVKGDLRSIDSAHIEAILDMCGRAEGHDRVMIPGVDALRSFDKLRLARPAAPNSQKRHYDLSLQLDTTLELPFHAGRVRLDLVNQDSSERGNCANFKDEQGFAELAKLDWDSVGGFAGLADLGIRNWEPGDAYQRLNRSGKEKLKALFQEYRVPLWERRHWPVLEFHDDIVWAREFGAAARFGAVEERSPVLMLRYWTGYESNTPVLTSR